MPSLLESLFVFIIMPAAGPVIGAAALAFALNALFSAFTELPKRPGQPRFYWWWWARLGAGLLALWVALWLVLALLSLCPLFIDCSDSTIVARRHIRIINTVIESGVLVLALALQISLASVCSQGGGSFRYLIYILALNIPLGLFRAILREFHDDPGTEYRAHVALFIITIAMQAVYELIAAVSFFATLKRFSGGGAFGSLRTVAALSFLRHFFGIVQPFFFPFDFTIDFLMFSSVFVTLSTTLCFKMMINVAVKYSALSLEEDPLNDDESRRPLLSASEQGTNGASEI